MSHRTLDRVQAAWGDVFGRSPSDPERDFFEFGGDSITAIKLQRALLDRTGAALSIAELIRHRTIGAQARRIEELRPDRPHDQEATDVA